VVLVGAVYGSVRRPRAAATHPFAIISRVSKSLAKNIRRRRLENDEGDDGTGGDGTAESLHTGISLMLHEGEIMDGMSIHIETGESDAEENGVKFTFSAKNGAEALQTALQDMCDAIIEEETSNDGSDASPDRRRLEGDDKPHCKAGSDEEGTAYLFFSDEEVENVGNNHGVPPPSENPIKDQDAPIIGGNIAFGRSFAEMLAAVPENKNIPLLPQGVKVGLHAKLARAIADTAESEVDDENPEKHWLQDFEAFQAVNLDFEFQYDKEKLETCPQRQPAEPIFKGLYEDMAKDTPSSFKSAMQSLVDEIEEVKSMECLAEDVHGREAVTITFTNFQYGELISKILEHME